MCKIALVVHVRRNCVEIFEKTRTCTLELDVSLYMYSYRNVFFHKHIISMNKLDKNRPMTYFPPLREYTPHVQYSIPHDCCGILIYTYSVLTNFNLKPEHWSLCIKQWSYRIWGGGGYLELTVKNLNCVFDYFHQRQRRKYKNLFLPLGADYLLSSIFCSNSKRLKFINSSVI